MLFTHEASEADPNRPLAKPSRRKPTCSMVIALVASRLDELPPNSLRRQVLELMIDRALE